MTKKEVIDAFEGFSDWFKENTPKEGLSENTTFTRQFLIDAWNNGYINGYNKAKNRKGLNAKINATTISDCPIKAEWHKVADGDLPTKTGEYWTNIGVLVWDYYADGRYGWHTELCECCDCCDDVDSDEVIAWCEIPQYEEE